MKPNRNIIAIAGILVFLSIVLTFVWLLPPANSKLPNELGFDEALSRIDGKQIKEAAFQADSVELTDHEGKKFSVKVGSEPSREALISKIIKYNEKNTGASIKYSEEPASSGWGWFVLINSLPFFIMWAATLAVIVYAVRTLSRNKG